MVLGEPPQHRVSADTSYISLGSIELEKLSQIEPTHHDVEVRMSGLDRIELPHQPGQANTITPPCRIRG